jgi:hypothetical protein
LFGLLWTGLVPKPKLITLENRDKQGTGGKNNNKKGVIRA